MKNIAGNIYLRLLDVQAIPYILQYVTVTVSLFDASKPAQSPSLEAFTATSSAQNLQNVPERGHKTCDVTSIRLITYILDGHMVRLDVGRRIVRDSEPEGVSGAPIVCTSDTFTLSGSARGARVLLSSGFTASAVQTEGIIRKSDDTATKIPRSK